MPAEIVVPELGESVLEATVARWLKQEGERVAQGEAVVELETEKVNLEVSARHAGVLSSITRQAGEDVQVGDVLGLIEEAEEPAAAPPEAGEAGQPEATSQASPAPPEAGEAGQPEATSQAPPSPAEAERKTARAGRRPSNGGEEARRETQTRATPVARRLAEEKEIDLAEVPSRSSTGRVTKEDVRDYLERERQAEPAPAPVPRAPARPVDGRDREERVRMSRRRRTIARRLVEAQQTAAMLTTFNEVDMSAVMELRRRRRDAFQERHGVKLGIVSFFVKAAIGALKAFPELNAEIEGDDVILKHYYDIGVAIGASEGLVVPVLRDADRMSFAGIERAVKELARKAEEGGLSLEDLRGGTFTITNGGVFGSLLSTPILNPPQVGILGLHKIEDRPVALDGQVVIRPMMYVALSYDHRIVDGREAVRFLVRLKELVEDPETLLLEG
jgi:2-oxoglutarate dehydrogenase E2 component (dihydrolipoamide succinyltransferase)